MELKNNKPVGSLPQQILSQTLDLVTDGIVVIDEKLYGSNRLLYGLLTKNRENLQAIEKKAKRIACF